MLEEVKKEDKFVVKVSCELEEDILETITNQIYERLIEKFEKSLRSAYKPHF